jgi:DNA-directed RNA polymerase subunit E'/Rpb7
MESLKKFKKREQKIYPIYSRCLITKSVTLPIINIGKNIKEQIDKSIAFHFEGKCLVEGYIRPNSTKVITYSSGLVNRGNLITFEVVFECEVCFPVEGTLIMCVAKNITKAGIRAESSEEIPSPIDVFVAKDHHYSNTQFSEIKEGDKFTVRVIGQRFELNDKKISIIAELVKPKLDKDLVKKPQINKPKLVIEDE